MYHKCSRKQFILIKYINVLNKMSVKVIIIYIYSVFAGLSLYFESTSSPISPQQQYSFSPGMSSLHDDIQIFVVCGLRLIFGTEH